jgi:protoporphyrinogen oxidase
MRICVIGAGPAGITAAHLLSAAGHCVSVYEADADVGGMAKSFDLWGQRVDLGPHRFFSSDPRINNLWLEMVGTDYDLVSRLTRIYYKRKFYYYPLKPFDALVKMGIFEACRCVGSYLGEKVSSTPQNGTFENWVTSRFGRRLYEIFFKTYSEKLWGIQCTELDADFAAQRIKKLSLSAALLNALTRGKGNTHKTLIDQFGYPHAGSGMVYERMAAQVRQNGGQVYTRCPVRRVLVENRRAIGVQLLSGEELTFDHVISTMPLTRLVEGLNEVPADIVAHVGKLTFRNTILVYLRVDAENVFPDNWLYIHSADLLTGRITNFRNWTPRLYGAEKSTIVALEYWCYDDDALWNTRVEDLVALGARELRATGLIGNTSISAGHVEKIQASYPVYRRGYKDYLRPVEDYLDTIAALTPIGRGGAFKYNNQDHSILMGLLAAENILHQAGHNLWQINTDSEYQEKSAIKETGL